MGSCFLTASPLCPASPDQRADDPVTTPGTPLRGLAMESPTAVSFLRGKLKFFKTRQAIFIYVTMFYLMFMLIQRPKFVPGAEFSSSKGGMKFILILCGGTGTQGAPMASDLNRQFRQAEVMLKSAAIFTRRKLYFHVIADSAKLFSRMVNITAAWPAKYKNKVKFIMHDVWYPTERQDMKSMFRVCATERLFIPDMFPAMDRAIYVDTDLIFLRPPEDLWSFFDDFNSAHVAAMAPCLYHYDTPRNKVPHYGETGLNAGIMHMDLARMRDIPDGWTRANMAMHDKYKKQIKLADQDILNILFHYYPDLLYELPCEWNYRVWQCSQGDNKCQTAEDNGVSILHGNALAFVKGNEMKIQTVFESFEQFEMGRNSLDQLYSWIVTGLEKVDREDLPSKCKNVPHIDNILLAQLEKQIRKLVRK